MYRYYKGISMQQADSCQPAVVEGLVWTCCLKKVWPWLQRYKQYSLLSGTKRRLSTLRTPQSGGQSLLSISEWSQSVGPTAWCCWTASCVRLIPSCAVNITMNPGTGCGFEMQVSSRRRPMIFIFVDILIVRLFVDVYWYLQYYFGLWFVLHTFPPPPFPPPWLVALPWSVQPSRKVGRCYSQH